MITGIAYDIMYWGIVAVSTIPVAGMAVYLAVDAVKTKREEN